MASSAQPLLDYAFSEETQGTYHIELRDLTGRLILTRSQCQGTCTLQREGAASGLYELLIQGEGVHAHQRVVLK